MVFDLEFKQIRQIYFDPKIHIKVSEDFEVTKDVAIV